MLATGQHMLGFLELLCPGVRSVWMYVCAYLCVCVCVCMCVYTGGGNRGLGDMAPLKVKASPLHRNVILQ